MRALVPGISWTLARRETGLPFGPPRTARSRLRSPAVLSSEFVPSACLDSITYLAGGRDHSAYIPDHDGRAAGATTIARKRSVFANVLRYAVELGELPSSPLDRLSWKPPRVSEAVSPRVVVNPRQARELLTAVTYVGQYRRGPYARGHRLMAFYAYMYFAALRPGEPVALRVHDCYLPDTGWGRLILEKSRPEVNRRWTDTASAHDERGLKHRPATKTRRVPIPAELVAILRQHIDTFGIASDGRIFSSDRGGPVASTAISDVWAEARTLALTPAQVASPLVRRPYDLRHAAVWIIRTPRCRAWGRPRSSRIYPTANGIARPVVASDCIARRRVRDAVASLSRCFWWWQVQDSKLGKRSRRFFRPSLLASAHST